MTIKITLLAALSLFLLAPAGCDEATEQSALARDVVRGIAPVEDLDLVDDEELEAAAAQIDGDFELMSPAHSSNDDHKQLCCGHGTTTWDCSGDKDGKKGKLDSEECEASPDCTLGACQTIGADDVPSDPDPIDPPILLGEEPLQY